MSTFDATPVEGFSFPLSSGAASTAGVLAPFYPLLAKDADRRSGPQPTAEPAAPATVPTPSQPSVPSMKTATPPVPSGARVTRESVNAAFKEYGAILARNAALPLLHGTAEQKNLLALEAAAIFATEFNGNPTVQGMPIQEALKAADFTDPAANLGLLSGTLALQSTLSRMQFEYPQINSVFTDFSTAPGLFRQTEMSRIVLTPAVQSFNPGTDSTGRPLAWNTVSTAQTIDVPITLDEYIAVPIVFGNTTLASTARNLFGEVASQALYSLGGYFVRKLMALLTAANYNAYAATSVAGAATAAGSTTITLSGAGNTTAGMYPGQLVSGAGIATNSFVLIVTSATTATLNNPATATGAGVTLTLGSTPTKVPQTYTTYAQAKANFNMGSLGTIGAAFDNNEVPQMDRSVIGEQKAAIKANTERVQRTRRTVSEKARRAGLQLPATDNLHRLEAQRRLTDLMNHSASEETATE